MRLPVQDNFTTILHHNRQQGIGINITKAILHHQCLQLGIVDALQIISHATTHSIISNNNGLEQADTCSSTHPDPSISNPW
jgi:succinyl-CoA synthetase beta subunit